MIIIICIFLALLVAPISSSSQVSISISHDTLQKSGDPVTINWSGVDSPSNLDWLGIYSPPDSPSNHFIGYVFLSTSPTWQSGSGSLNISLVNLRSNYKFRIYRWTQSEVNPDHQDHDHNPIPGTKHLLAESSELGFEKGRGPEQIHIALTDKDDEMRVMFVTADGKDNIVKFGLDSDRLEQEVGTTVTRYEREDMCDAPANHSIGWRDPGYIHDGVITNLQKGKKYYYKVGSEGEGGWSTTYSFLTQNEESNITVGFLFGDMGTATSYNTFIRTQDESISTIKWITRDLEALGDVAAMISHVGDISYARGYSWIWDHFFTQIQPIAAKVPYHVCIGNHEYDWPSQPWRPTWANSIYGKDGGGECGVPYSLRFNMPGNSSEPTGTRAPATRNLYYSFNMGVVHFVYLSTETNFLPESNQYKFIKQDLESVDRNKTPFVVVQGHRPMYTTSNENRDGPFRDRMLEHLEPLFVENKVTVALWGHVHRYERFCPINNYTCGSEELPVHVVIGMAGQDWQPIWQPRRDHPNDPIFPQPSRSLYRTGEFGYTRLVATREKMKLSYVGNHDGEVHDMVEFMASGVTNDRHDDGDMEVVKRVEHGRSIGVDKKMELDSGFGGYTKGVIVLIVGAFGGYVLGYISHARRRGSAEKGWSPVKADEI
ncbi:probable inactive purple acid phosphatase 2 [Impatiens glandulifera]|uniref:probable inactive purple acid phosphatase 2 n=1 Tax=Impatiens glandulifera TaxID=253017 RepID=UPI001FB0AB3F|nr:probable inactive purple acid phosphatase 2 [Impatiens glandulifera]